MSSPMEVFDESYWGAMDDVARAMSDVLKEVGPPPTWTGQVGVQTLIHDPEDLYGDHDDINPKSNEGDDASRVVILSEEGDY